MSCLNLRAESGAVKSAEKFIHGINNAGSDAGRPPGRPGASWVNRVPIDFLDARNNGGLGHRVGWMLLVLEGYCRARPFCWVGNAELAHAYGCDTGSLKRLLRQMEADGLIHRIPTAEGRPGRLGIVLLVRANPDLPVADRAGLPELIARMGRDRGAETPPAGGRKGAPSRGAETPPRITTLIPKNDEIEEPTLTFAHAGGGDPTPEVCPPTIPPPVVAAPGGPVEPPAPREAPGTDPTDGEGVPGRPGAQGPPPAVPGAGTDQTREQLEAAIAEVEGRIVRRAPRPAEAMDRIRLRNLRDLRDGTWKADPLAGVTPAKTPRLEAWAAAVGPPAACPVPSRGSSPPVETSELIRRCGRRDGGPEAVEAAARRVAERLGDGHSLAWYRRAFARVQSGEVPVSRALSAWKAASGGTARVPGSVFTAFLKGAH